MTVPAFGSITVDECASPFRVKTRFDGASNRIASASSAAGIRPSTLYVVQIEHDHGLVVAGGGEAVAGGLGDGRAVRAVDAGDFAEQLAGVLVHDHDARLTRDEQPVVRRIRHDVVPAAVAAERISMSDAIDRRLREDGRREKGTDEHEEERTHESLRAQFTPLISTAPIRIGWTALGRRPGAGVRWSGVRFVVQGPRFGPWFTVRAAHENRTTHGELRTEPRTPNQRTGPRTTGPKDPGRRVTAYLTPTSHRAGLRAIVLALCATHAGRRNRLPDQRVSRDHDECAASRRHRVTFAA